MKPLSIEHLMDNEVQTLSGGKLVCVKSSLCYEGKLFR